MGERKPKPKWRTLLIRGDHRALAAALNAGVGPRDYFLHEILTAAGGFVLVYIAISPEVLADQRRRARQLAGRRHA